MKRFFRITARTLLILALVAVVLPVFAPYLLNSRLLPHLLRGNGLDGVEVRISRLTPWTLSGTLLLGRNTRQEAAASVHFRSDYSPLGLLRGRITAMTLDGAIIRLVKTDGKLQLQGFPPTETSNTARPTALVMPVLPVMLESLILRNCQILLTYGEGLTLPLVLQGKVRPDFETTPAGDYRLRTLQAELFSESLLPASLTAKADFRDDTVRLNFTGQLQESAALPGLLSLPAGLRLTGPTQLEGELLVAADPRAGRHIDARLRFPALTAAANGFGLSSSAETPLRFALKGTGTALTFSVEHINITQPVHIQAGLEGTFQPATGDITGKGEIRSDMLQFPATVAMQGKLSPDSPDLTVSLEGDRQQLQAGGQTMEFGPYRLSAHLTQDHGSLLLTEELQLDSVNLPAHTLLLENLTSRATFAVNPADAGKAVPGTVSVARIRYKKEDLAGLSGTVAQTADGLRFAGELASHRDRSLRATFSGTSTLALPLSLSFKLPATTVTDKSMPTLAALPSGLSFSGRLHGSGTFTYGAGTPHGEAKLSLSEGKVDLKAKKIHLGGISADLSLPSLPQLASSPSQELRIAAFNIGNLKFSDGRIVFRIEDAKTLFIEKSRFTWCSGRVESGSLHISLADPELSTTLYCDRLQFSELLGQLGISESEGDGSLNGRLPLHFTGKEMIFDDGFLFSTPGNSGIVRFNNTTMLRQGLPESGQAAYLEYSMQAMKNFSYNWTKLTFNSQGDDLLITMQIDGKPATPLPFGYRNGLLVAEAGGKGIQHPIRLDVNFHLPFAQMFKYGQNLQKIMENTK